MENVVRDAREQIERTQTRGGWGWNPAGFRTRRDARYNRAVVPWWWRDCSPGGSLWWGTKYYIYPRIQNQSHCFPWWKLGGVFIRTDRRLK